MQQVSQDPGSYSLEGPDQQLALSSWSSLARLRHSPALNLAIFVIQRLLFGAVVLGAITFLTFMGLDMARGASTGDAIVGALQQSVDYLGRLLQGDLGISQSGTLAPRAMPVGEVLWEVVSKSLGLLGVSLVIATVVGSLLGMWAALRRRSGWSVAMIVVSIVGISVPSFFAALILQLIMVQWARAFGSPLLPIGGFGWDSHILLPAIVLATRPIAQIARMTFITVGDVLDQDYVRTAQSKGLWPRQVWLRHVMRNAAVPVLTTVGISVRFALSSLPVVEFFFGWPGLGFALLKSIAAQDDDVTVALVLCLGVLFVLTNLLLELSYRVFDPRLRDQASDVSKRERRTLAQWLGDTWISLRDLVRYNPVTDWIRHRRTSSQPSPFQRVLEQHGQPQRSDVDRYGLERRRAWWRGTLGNLPFVLGALLVALLLFVFFLGPRLAPHNPYATQGLTIIDGEFLVPPFEPGESYPLGSDALGRDVLSLILSGAQQTLVLAVLVVLARLLVGTVLGALAGWTSGSWLDRGLMAVVEIIAAFPTLLLAMILILALGIRQGMVPFIVALCFAGWGEIMQFVRSEVMALRPQPFIESATAIGLRTPRIVVAHVMPNLLSALVSLAALEMGAVLMVLGELGFIGIFIGGGAFAELDIGGAFYHYSDVPEWGSLLSSVRTYARAYPWMAIYPALAFFIAILGFNLFGEGLRRMITTVGVGLNRLINRYTVLAFVLAFLAVGWIQGNTGSMAFYRQQARQFQGSLAYQQVETLAQPTWQDRSLATSGMDAAADWIATRFADLDLQPAGQELGYFQNRTRSYQSVDDLPRLYIDDGGAAPVYLHDFVEYASEYRNLGQAKGPIRVLLARNLIQGAWMNPYPMLEDLVSPEDIVLVLSEREATYLDSVPHKAMLVVTEDDTKLRRHETLSSRTRVWQAFGTGRDEGQDSLAFRISEDLANRLLAGTGQTVASLQEETRRLEDNGLAFFWTKSTVDMAITGTAHERVPARHVIGYLPGAAGRATPGEGQLDNQLVVVLAQFDSPPKGPTGCCPATNDNASGTAVMLEAIRTLQESAYQPYRTFLFVAYSGEGLDGGEPVRPEEVSKFLQAKAGFVSAYEVETIVHLRGLGAGAEDSLVLASGGNQRLAAVFERAARQVGVSTRRAEEEVDISVVFADRRTNEGGGQEAPFIELSWDGWQNTARTAADTLEIVSPDQLEKAGRTLALALMIMGRENRY